MGQNNPFGAEGWSYSRLPDLKGKHYVITGGNSGIGFEATKELCARQAAVTILCRNQDKAQNAIDEIKATNADARIDFVQVDLASLGSVRDAAALVKDKAPQIDALICNAGLMMLPRRELTGDGFETQFGVNHMGHFLLCHRLFDNVIAAEGRFVVVSSVAHRWGLERIKFEDLAFEEGYSPTRSYGQSKLANMLFVQALNRKLETAGLPSRAFVCHPGYSATNLQTTGPGPISGAVMSLSNRLLAQSANKGAKSVCLCAVDDGARPATFYGPTKYGNMLGPVGECPISRAGQDMDAAEELWQLSCDKAGVEWSI